VEISIKPTSHYYATSSLAIASGNTGNGMSSMFIKLMLFLCIRYTAQYLMFANGAFDDEMLQTRNDFTKYSLWSTSSAILKWKPHVAPDMHLGRRMVSAESASTQGDLTGTRKRQSCHKPLTGNWNII